MLSLIHGPSLKVFFYKGPNFEALEKNEIDLVEKNGWKRLCLESFSVKGTEGRTLYGVQRNVPRRTIKEKNLVKFSELMNNI